MEVSVRGRPECGVSAARPDDTGRAENGENLSRGRNPLNLILFSKIRKGKSPDRSGPHKGSYQGGGHVVDYIE